MVTILKSLQVTESLSELLNSTIVTQKQPQAVCKELGTPVSQYNSFKAEFGMQAVVCWDLTWTIMRS